MSSRRSRNGIAAVSLLGMVLAAGSATAQDGMPSLAEALALAFPGATLTAPTHALDDAARARVGAAAGVECRLREIVRHEARREGAVVGYAFVDRRRVRTHAQELLVVLGADGRVRRVEVLAFAEPRRYRPAPGFFGQFEGRGLDDELQLRRGIRPVAGATLSARAAVDAVRTVLAMHAELQRQALAVRGDRRDSRHRSAARRDPGKS